MLGFTARAESDSISLQDQELEDARWFTREEIIARLKDGTLRMPSSISIAYRLIEDWFDVEAPGPVEKFLAAAQGRILIGSSSYGKYTVLVRVAPGLCPDAVKFRSSAGENRPGTVSCATLGEGRLSA